MIDRLLPNHTIRIRTRKERGCGEGLGQTARHGGLPCVREERTSSRSHNDWQNKPRPIESSATSRIWTQGQPGTDLASVRRSHCGVGWSRRRKRVVAQGLSQLLSPVPKNDVHPANRTVQFRVPQKLCSALPLSDRWENWETACLMLQIANHSAGHYSQV
jgi:hypothetical protein